MLPAPRSEHRAATVEGDPGISGLPTDHRGPAPPPCLDPTDSGQPTTVISLPLGHSGQAACAGTRRHTSYLPLQSEMAIELLELPLQLPLQLLVLFPLLVDLPVLVTVRRQ